MSSYIRGDQPKNCGMMVNEGVSMVVGVYERGKGGRWVPGSAGQSVDKQTIIPVECFVCNVIYATSVVSNSRGMLLPYYVSNVS